MNREKHSRHATSGHSPGTPFPPTSEALESPNGLLAWGGDLQPERLLAAYRSGIFPWYSEGQPILWWSPAPRCVIFPDKVYLSTRTRRRYNSGVYRLSVDSAFAEVINGCAEPRGGDNGTWITQEMLEAYVTCISLAMPTRLKSGRMTCWSAASTAWRWAPSFLANPCSAVGPTPARSHWWRCASICTSVDTGCWTAR